MFNLIANCKCCGEFASASLLQYFRESSSEYNDNQYIQVSVFLVAKLFSSSPSAVICQIKDVK